MSAVAFQLALTRTSGSDAATQTGQAGSQAAQPGQPVLELCQLDLQAALTGLRTLGKNIQNQGGAVDDGGVYHLLDILQLGRRQLVVKNHQIDILSADKIRHLLQAPSAHQGSRVRLFLLLDDPPHHLCAGRLRQLLQLVDGALYIKFSGVHRRQQGGLLLLFVLVHILFLSGCAIFAFLSYAPRGRTMPSGYFTALSIALTSCVDSSEEACRATEMMAFSPVSTSCAALSPK